MTPRARPWRVLAAAALAFVAVAAAAADDVALTTAWMRPAPAGAPAARAYVDIRSAATLDLVGAATPVAAQVVLVRVPRLDDPASEEVVPSLPVPAGKVTRLAYRGDHLRLVDVKQDLANGTPVPLTLVFRDSQGRESRAATTITVRGLVLPAAGGPQSAPRAGDAATAATGSR